MITVTEVAAGKIKHFLSARNYGIGIRIGVKTTGCSGFAYKLEYCDETTPTDTVFDSNGVKIIIDAKSLPMLDGMTIDYAKKGLNEGFEFVNPAEVGRCGCGESFRV